MNYESRLERLERALGDGDDEHVKRAIAFLYDSNTRPADHLELNGQRFARGEYESVAQLKSRAIAAIGANHWALLIAHFVATNGNGGLKFTAAEREPADEAGLDDRAVVYLPLGRIC